MASQAHQTGRSLANVGRHRYQPASPRQVERSAKGLGATVRPPSPSSTPDHPSSQVRSVFGRRMRQGQLPACTGLAVSRRGERVVWFPRSTWPDSRPSLVGAAHPGLRRPMIAVVRVCTDEETCDSRRQCCRVPASIGAHLLSRQAPEFRRSATPIRGVPTGWSQRRPSWSPFPPLKRPVAPGASAAETAPSWTSRPYSEAQLQQERSPPAPQRNALKGLGLR